MANDYPVKVRKLPLKGRYRTNHQEFLDRNREIDRIEEYVNRMCYQNIEENQLHLFASVALDLHLDTEFVRASIVGGGNNGIMVQVTTAHRMALERRFGQRSD